MRRRLITNNRCPLCGEEVQVIPDSVLKKNPHMHDTELVVTRTGIKQYIHSSCWYKMIEEKRPYNGKMYVQLVREIYTSYYEKVSYGGVNNGRLARRG